MDKKYLSLRILLVGVSAYHILFGALAFLSENMAASIAKTIFGMNLIVTPQLSYMAKLLGVYAFIFGIFMIIAAYKPKENKLIIYAGILLYAIRVINRFVFGDLVQQAFDVSNTGMWIEMGLLSFFGALLFLLRPKE